MGCLETHLSVPLGTNPTSRNPDGYGGRVKLRAHGGMATPDLTASHRFHVDDCFCVRAQGQCAFFSPRSPLPWVLDGVMRFPERCRQCPQLFRA